MPSHAPAPSFPLRIAHAVQRGRPVRFFMDGQPVDGFAGESLAASLMAAGHRALRQSPRGGMPRGAFCFMGSCQECLVWVGARKLPACQVPVAEGLEVTSLAAREAGQ